MTEVAAAPEVPVYSECVLGFRAWWADESGQLWPATPRHRPWVPGINIARCDCRIPGSLQFEWSWRDGRRVLTPLPLHEAPQESCSCGLYSLARPRHEWLVRPELSSPPHVVGAIASWGRLQVHGVGCRAEHACVIALGRHPEASREAVEQLERIAERYRVELVVMNELEQAARRHASPLPDAVHAAALAPPPETAVAPAPRAPDLEPDDVPPATQRLQSPRWGLIDPLARPHRSASLRVRLALLTAECCIALALIALAIVTYDQSTTTSYVQRQGLRATGYIEAARHQTCGLPYQSQTCIETSFVVKLVHPVDGVWRLSLAYPRYVSTPTTRPVALRIDPRNPHYAELAGQPQGSAVVWVIAAILAVLCLVVTALDGVHVGRTWRRQRATAQTAG